MPKTTKTETAKSEVPRCLRLAPGMRVLVHLESEEIPGTVYLDGEGVDLDRRAKDPSVHKYADTDAFGRATRIEGIGASNCSLLVVDNPPPPKTCPHCGEAL